MKRSLLTIGLLLCVQLAGTALAGNQVSIRLVEARSGRPHLGPGLADVAATLKSTRYNHFTLLASSGVALPARGTASQLGAYTVVCSGAQQNLQISVRRGRKPLLSTTWRLRDGKPVVIGGFPAQGGKHILVFLAR